jgi:hypothetical protein
MTVASRCAWLSAAVLVAHVAAAAAQDAGPVAPPGSAAPAAARLPVTMSGGLTIGSELYTVNGIPARRPGQTWQVVMSPELSLFGQFDVGLSVLLSSEGSELRQNMSQLGLNPRFGWATLHLGDFTRSYSSYTLQGTQLRGVGLDLNPGILRVSFQGGTSQRTVAAGPAGTAGLAYRRHLYAASLGVGRDGGSFLDFTVVKAKDDVSSLATALADTTLLDTIPVALRPRIETRPQENLVLGSQGQIRLLRDRVSVKGEAAFALITRDLESPQANPSPVPAGNTLDGLMPLQLSTSGDYAWHLQADGAFGAASLHGGYEYVGAGYTSLGLAYLINDRRAVDLGGSVRLLRSHLVLQGQYQHQNDNLLHQKLTTTDRDAVVGSAMLLLGRSVSTSLTIMSTVIANDATVDTFVVNSHTFALTTATSLQAHLLGWAATYSVSYALQHASDANPITRIPDVTVHNLSASVQVRLSGAVSVAPTASLAVTRNAAAPTQSNVYLGFRGNARTGRLRTSASVTQTFSSGRRVFGLLGQADYPLPWDARLSFQARHTRYGAIGAQPAFQESFATLSLTRSF